MQKPKACQESNQRQKRNPSLLISPNGDGDGTARRLRRVRSRRRSSVAHGRIGID
jgi:hypothetical protein